MHDVTAFVSHEDASRHDTGWSHPDHQGRLPAIVRAVQRDMVALWEPLRQIEGMPASEDDLGLIHTPEYIARVRAVADEAARAGRTLEVDGVPVRIKVSPGRVKVEHDDAARAARKAGMPLREAVRRAEEAWHRRVEQDPGSDDDAS